MLSNVSFVFYVCMFQLLWSEFCQIIRQQWNSDRIFSNFILGNIFNGTAGPLLPDNIAFQSLNKMWRSPSSEKLSLNISREATPIINEKEGRSRSNSRGPLSRKGSLCNTLNAIMDTKISRKLSHHEPLISCPPDLFKEKM